MRVHQRVMAICLGLTALGTAACSDSTAPADVATIEINAADNQLRGGASMILVATARDADGNVVNGAPVSWISSDPSVASVNTVGMVTGEDNGAATITAAVGGAQDTFSMTVYVGVTGAWEGSLTSPSGTTTCPMTQSLVEALDGSITGTGTTGSPCAVGSYTVNGNNDVGGVADSVETTWTGPFTITFNGNYDGGDTMSGLMGGACADCTFTFTRTSVQPAPTVRAAGRNPIGAGSRSFLP